MGGMTQIFEVNALYIKVKYYCLTCFIFLFFIILGFVRLGFLLMHWATENVLFTIWWNVSH